MILFYVKYALYKLQPSHSIHAYLNLVLQNFQGMTAVHLAVYKFETRRNLDILETLLEHGANPCLKAASPPKANKLSIVRHDSKGHSDGSAETKKISLDQKTPLLLALELKSVLYLRGIYSYPILGNCLIFKIFW